MAENLSVARPYAEAAFQQAREADALGSWLAALERFVAVTGNPEMADVVSSPKMTDDGLFALMVDVVGDGVTEDQKNFLRILVENDRLAALPEIRDLFMEKKNAQEGVLEAEVVSAFELDEKTLKRLQKDLEEQFKAKLEIQVRVDPELIGGVRIAIGDEVIDTSVRSKLADMAAALKN